jgi:hypothetical protein
VGTEALVVAVVVGARFFVPLLIPRFPLPGVLASLVLDAADQSVFAAFGYHPAGYQGYDKAMDVYYLAIAYTSTLRNWTSSPAFAVSRFLYFYRLVGVTAFELSGWRPLLLIFPNTFEYFFIAYELVRTRRDPARYSLRFWVWVAAAIWVFVKLPQEWWIHIAQLDFTDELDAHPALGPTIVVALLAAAAGYWWVLRPRLSPPAWPLRIAADPLPEQSRTWRQRAAWTVQHERAWSADTVEKVVLVGLIGVIYGQVLPGLDVTSLQLFLGLAALVVVNAAVVVGLARARLGTDSALLAFAVRLGLDVTIVVVARVLLGGDRVDVRAALFFVAMLCLITLLHDRYVPVRAARATISARARSSSGSGDAAAPSREAPRQRRHAAGSSTPGLP